MIRPIYTWIITIVAIAIGIFPYKLPDTNPVIDEKNKLVVTHRECTCCADLDIERGELEVPQKFKKFFPDKINELTIDDSNKPIFLINHDLLSGYFVLKGDIVGVDSSESSIQMGDCQVRPIFRISEWSPTEYRSNYFTFSAPIFIVYLVITLGLIIYSIVCTIKKGRERK